MGGQPRGVEGMVMMLTLGTGIGTALFTQGKLMPNSEFGHLMIRDREAELRASDRIRKQEDLSWKQWAKRLNEYLATMEALFWPDLIIVGGGVSEKADKFVPKELVARYEVEGAAPVEVDREEVARLGVRLREAALLAEDAEAGLRHDPDRLARQACEAALVRLQSPAN